MLRTPLNHIRRNAVAYLALFVSLGGTTAYAANTIRSSDIIDNEVTTTDVRDDTLGFGGLFHQDLAAGSVRSSEVLDSALNGVDIADGTVSGADIQNLSLTTNDVAANTFTGSDIADNSLTGTDINESSLNMPPTTTATFAAATTRVDATSGFVKVASKILPAGPYAVVATANMDVFAGGSGTNVTTAICELRNGNGVIGGATDRRTRPGGDSVFRSMTMNGGAQVPAGGGEVSLRCRTQEFSETTYAQMMMIRIDGFF